MRRLPLLLTGTLLLLVALAASPMASSTPGFPPAFPSFDVAKAFLTPSGNIDCNAGPVISPAGKLLKGRYGLDCVIFSIADPHNRGQVTWYMSDHGQARRGVVPANIAAGGPLPHLRYGSRFAYGGFSCRSERVGLTCRNRQGHGFFLSRQHQRLF